MGRSLKKPSIDRFFNGSIACVDHHYRDSGACSRW